MDEDDDDEDYYDDDDDDDGDDVSNVAGMTNSSVGGREHRVH